MPVKLDTSVLKQHDNLFIIFPLKLSCQGHLMVKARES